MKVSCIRVSTDLLIGKKHDKVTSYLAKNFLGIGVAIHNQVTTQNNPENIFGALNFVNTDFVFIIGEYSSGRNYGIKKALANYLNIKMIKNEQCVSAVNEYYKIENIPVLVESENEYYIPENAVPLSTNLSPMQGFILQHNNKTYIFLPDEMQVVKYSYENYLLPLLQENSGTKYKNIIIKTFGIYEKDIYSILGDLVKNVYKILFVTYPSDLEVTLQIRYNENLDQSIVRTFLAKVFERLNKYIYADEDVTLAQRAFDLLKIGSKTLAVAESVSGGTIASTISKMCSDVDKHLICGIVCPTPESKVKLMNVNKSIIDRYGEVSIETAYEMAAGLLETTNAEYVICTTGIAESEKENEKKTTFIAVGNIDGIHVYKNTFIGSRETVIDNITQTSLFYLIKNIRQNDLIFSETVV